MESNERPPYVADYLLLFLNEKPPNKINEFLRFPYGMNTVFRFASYHFLTSHVKRLLFACLLASAFFITFSDNNRYNLKLKFNFWFTPYFQTLLQNE